MTDVPAPLCMKCKHFQGYETDELNCDAFPRGIPQDIIIGGIEYIKPFIGDNGILFEPISKQEMEERVRKYKQKGTR